VQDLKKALEEGATNAPDGFANSDFAALAIVASHHGVHLTLEEIILDNAPSKANAPFERVVRCAQKAGLKAKALKLDWGGVTRLRKALPVVIRLKNGSCMVLTHVNLHDKANPVVVLQDPFASEDARSRSIASVLRTVGPAKRCSCGGGTRFRMRNSPSALA